MIFDDTDIDDLRSSGARITGVGGSQLKAPPKSLPAMEWVLRRLTDVLNELPDKIVEMMRQQQPKVVEVTPILPPYPEPEKRPRKWKFTHKRDSNGKIIETLAQAED